MSVGFLVADARYEARTRFARELRTVARLASVELTEESAAVLDLLAEVPEDPDWDRMLRGEIPCDVGIAPIGIFREVRADVVRADGSVVCSTAQGVAPPPTSLSEILAAEGPLIVAPYVDDAEEEMVVAAATPLDSSSGDRVGAMVLVLGLSPLAPGLASNLGGLGFSFRITAGERVVSEAGRSQDIHGSGALHADAVVPGHGLTVGAYVGPEKVSGASNDATRSLATAGGFGFACLGAALWALNRRLVRPLTALRRVVQAGDPAALPDEPAGPAEVASLQEALGTMMSTQARQADELRQQAFVDPLTGLPDRAALSRLLEAEFAAGEHQDSLVVIMLSVLRFDVLNDSWGQAFGDAVLVDLGARLREIAPAKYAVHHLGGAEFALASAGASAAEGLRLAHFPRTSIGAPHEVLGRQTQLDLAAGIAAAHDDDNADALIRHARTALGRAKAGEARGAAVFDVDLDAVVEERAELERDLRDAISRGELRLVYQPTIHLPSRRITGVEALVRWRHPTRGEIGPDRFIPVAEDSGLIVAIGAWVLRTACAEATKWHGLKEDLRLSVNVSPRQLADGDFAHLVHSVLVETGFDASCLCLEMTETVLMASDETALATLRVLQRTGVDISIDDFGTGYSSLSYIQRLGVDELKIDRAFVAALRPTDNAGIAMVRTILALARELSLTVIAEGIEEEDQVEMLLSLGCEQGQGFLFSRPIPPEVISSLLSEPSTA
jgi:diguanylate cyclase (GGDEF)-like protein